jgi:hypothetical protein
MCLGIPCKVMNQSIVGLSPLSETTYSASHEIPKASFVSTGSIPIGMDKYNKKIMIVIIRDPDLFRVEN